MESSKSLRWKQRFETFEQSFIKLAPFNEELFENELEEAGFIHFFEVAWEHGINTIIDYLDAQELPVDSHRQAIKEAKDFPFVKDDKVWLKALNRQNLTLYIHTDKVRHELIEDIQTHYFDQLNHFYHTLKQEL
ncbi:nucleotidyltransferase substrate binding protein [Alkalibacillus sp. S2W]|uniref:nucleotidyltransferase substrate binding protein n=1 Tax=Alkalibacillus sp. S2W TaxID=3386553 RepID=UPI00398C8E63